MIRIIKAVAMLAMAAMLLCAGESQAGPRPVYSGVYGTVVDAAGVPVGRARVRLVPARVGKSKAGVTSPSDGRRRRVTPSGTWLQIVLSKPRGDFAFKRVSPRPYVLHVSKPGVGTARVELFVKGETPTTDLTVTLHPSHRRH